MASDNSAGYDAKKVILNFLRICYVEFTQIVLLFITNKHNVLLFLYYGVSLIMNKWCEQLKKSCNLETDIDFDQYTEAISNLRGSDDPEVLKVMFRCFRDVEAGEVQFELVEACESYPDDIYLDVFIKESSSFKETSPYWYQLMFQSILNSQNCLNLLIEKLKKLGDDSNRFFPLKQGTDSC